MKRRCQEAANGVIDKLHAFDDHRVITCPLKLLPSGRELLGTYIHSMIVHRKSPWRALSMCINNDISSSVSLNTTIRYLFKPLLSNLIAIIRSSTMFQIPQTMLKQAKESKIKHPYRCYRSNLPLISMNRPLPIFLKTIRPSEIQLEHSRT